MKIIFDNDLFEVITEFQTREWYVTHPLVHHERNTLIDAFDCNLEFGGTCVNDGLWREPESNKVIATSPGKNLLQNCCTLKLKWDEELTERCRSVWQVWKICNELRYHESKRLSVLWIRVKTFCDSKELNWSAYISRYLTSEIGNCKFTESETWKSDPSFILPPDEHTDLILPEYDPELYRERGIATEPEKIVVFVRLKLVIREKEVVGVVTTEVSRLTVLETWHLTERNFSRKEYEYVIDESLHRNTCCEKINFFIEDQCLISVVGRVVNYSQQYDNMFGSYFVSRGRGKYCNDGGGVMHMQCPFIKFWSGCKREYLLLICFTSRILLNLKSS